MKSIRIFDRRAGSLVAAAIMLFSVTLPSLLTTASVYAGALTTRSIQLSDSAAGKTNVSYKVSFTPATTTAEAMIIDFCSDSPIPGQACNAPTGFDATDAATTAANTTVTGSTTRIKVAKSSGAITGSPYELELTDIDNPSTPNTTLYARILTYVDSTAMDLSSGPTDIETPVDQGGVAIAITNDISVSAAVMESMTFCVSGGSTAIGANCSSTTAPNLTLGKTTGSVTALDSSEISTGNIYTQLSTNANSGATVYMKSSAAGCGGLLLAGSNNCYIEPSASTGFTLGQAKFGVKLATASSTNASGAAAPSGTLQKATGSSYGNTNYFMNYDDDEEVGVTSPYGDAFLDSNNAPVSNQNMTITFGASVTPSTPAGQYSAKINLIAVGKF